MNQLKHNIHTLWQVTKKVCCICSLCLLVIACGKPSNTIPTSYTNINESVVLFPDYTDITIPANIAALNCIVKDSLAEAFVAHYHGDKGEMKVGAAKDGLLQIDTLAWRTLLEQHRGLDIHVDIYAQRANGWVKFPSFTLSVAEEDIDPYLSYRLIEPGYELYRQLGLYQRNLTTWEERVIYENNRKYDLDENHCVNCHNYQANSTKNMLFHVRASHGGTIIVQDGKARKVQIKDSTIITAGVYPSWHPTEEFVAFSTNKTGQVFHLYHPEKVEVLDTKSDLLFYDVKRNEVSHILRTKDDMETFPCWTPDGKRIFYTSAHIDSSLIDMNLPDSIIEIQATSKYNQIRYDLKSIGFDLATRQFGEPQMEVEAASRKRSISCPRVSPDGRFVLYTEGEYGQFHIWHKSADLWVKDLERDSCYALNEANSSDVDSFHSWSSNGRWIVFSSRRMDANYTRPFITYFDKEGRARKAFVLPQEDPMWNVLLLKSYNVPELTRDAVRISPEDLKNCIYNTDGEKAVKK